MRKPSLTITLAIELKPEYPKAYYRRGVAYAKNAEYAKAIADYNQVIQRES